MKCKSITKEVWRIETAESNGLFAEADRLNDIAYRLLNDRPTTPETIKRFQLAKDAENAKYEEAQRAWREAREHLKALVESDRNTRGINVIKSHEASNDMEAQAGKARHDG